MKKTVFSVFLFLTTIMTFSSAPQPEYWPICGSPQNTAPTQLAGGKSVAARASVVWNGKDYAGIWVDLTPSWPYFRKFYADGTPAGEPIAISTLVSYSGYDPNIVWNGSNYGVSWVADGGLGFSQIYFMILDPNGGPLSPAIKVSFYGSAETADCKYHSLAAGPDGYCVVWNDSRNGNDDIFATLLDGVGNVTNHDLPISTAALNQSTPEVAWSSGWNNYQCVWSDSRSGLPVDIYGSRISQGGGISANQPLVTSSALLFKPVLVDAGSFLGMAWEDPRDGNLEIYFARLAASGSKIGADIRITSDTNSSQLPRIVWTGAEFGIFWQDDRSGNRETWFQRVSASGSLQGNSLQVTSSSDIRWPDAAFAKYGYLVTGAQNQATNFVSAWGCAADTTLPSCPEGPMAYSITGTSATVSWLPSVEDYTDIAYYLLYRNNIEIAKTSNNFYADSGLSLNTTYKYDVRAVNAAGLTTTGCSNASMYLKTNATLTLMLEKAETDAILTWNDEGMNFYNVFRGTSPQQMSLIGNTDTLTHEDPNVLLDRVNYFYTVDDPGQ